jgi:chemotaxis protein MotB
MRAAALAVAGVCVTLGGTSGCVSLEQHRRLEAANRRLAAEKVQLQQEMQDIRGGQKGMRDRAEAFERELQLKEELVANLRRENEVLDEFNRATQAELARMASSTRLEEIPIVAKLPEALDTALKSFAEQHPADVEYDARNGTVRWKADLLFAIGSDVVRESSLPALQDFATVIQSPAAKDFEVVIVGHTDNKPISSEAVRASHPTNWHLSGHRAIAVARVLLQNGYAAERIGVMGCGEYRPVADNSTEAGASQNRRVEIYLVPLGVFRSARQG